MAQQATSSPWARPFSTSRTPAPKPGSSQISLFHPGGSWDTELPPLALLPGIPAPFPHAVMTEHAKAPSRPGLAAVGEGVQGPREERVLIWSVSGNHHAHVSTITALGLVTPEGEPDAQR